MTRQRPRDFIQGALFCHPSTLTYIAWTMLYGALTVFSLFRRAVPRLFAEILLADVVINMVSPLLIGAAALLAGALAKGSPTAPWTLYPLLILGVGLLLIFPVALSLHLGGWWMLAGAALFFGHLNWIFLRRRAGNYIALLAVRGIAGPFFFFAPALIIACLYVGRNTLGMENTDWVPIFGTVYFAIQAGFEEFMLRRAGRQTPSSRR